MTKIVGIKGERCGEKETCFGHFQPEYPSDTKVKTSTRWMVMGLEMCRYLGVKRETVLQVTELHEVTEMRYTNKNWLNNTQYSINREKKIVIPK